MPRSSQPSSSDRRLLDDLIQLVSETPLQPERWNEAARGFAELLGGTDAGIFFGSTRLRDTFVPAARTLEPRWLEAYDQHFHKFDERTRLINRLPAGAVFLGHRLLPDAVLRSSPFYQEFLRPQRLLHIAGIRLLADDGGAVLRVLRHDDEQAFGNRETALLERFGPHVRCALEVTRRMNEMQSLVVDLLERFPGAVLVLDQRGRLEHANVAGHRLLATDGPLERQHDGTVHARNPIQQLVFQACLARAQGSDTSDSGRLAVARLQPPQHDRPLTLTAVPRRLCPPGCATGIMLLVRDPADRLAASAESVARELGLTRAQASIALALANGETLEQIALSRHSTLDTVRTHLKGALARTGTHRQTQLIRLVMLSGAVLVDPSRGH